VDDGERVGSGGSVEIVDLTQEHLGGYLCCLEEWSDEMTEAGDHKARWYEVMKDRGLRVKLAMEKGTPVGMIQYLPIEESIAEGAGLAMILCIWVHGYRGRGVGDHQGHGIGTALLEAAEADAQSLGFKGMAAWGVTMPFWMRSSWFKKHGYRRADNVGGSELVWKPFVDDLDPPRWIPNGPVPEAVEGQVTVTGFLSGWCPAMNLTFERARRAAEEIGPPVVFASIDTTEHHAKHRFGHSDAVFLDGKPLQTGKPPSYETIERKIRNRVRSVRRH
jgi:GNAT superfamily N-acetyltransferase